MAYTALWEAASKVLMFVSAIMTGIIFVKFFIINFIAIEKYHPLDYFSNKMRTKPPCCLLMMVALGGSMWGLILSGQLMLFMQMLPEVAIAVYAQGIIICVKIFVGYSAAAALVAVLLYAVVSIVNIMAVMVVTPPDEPGWIYGSAFLVINFVWIVLLRIAIKRHVGRDGKENPLPPGADKLPKLWAEGVILGTFPILVSTNIVYFVAYLVSVGKYGWACAISLYTVSGVLLLGCCYSYRSGTELEDGAII